MPLLEIPPYRVIKIRDGVGGTEDTLELMRQLIMAGKKDPAIRVFAAKLVNHIRENGGNGKNRIAEIETVYNFVRDKIRYVWDIEGVETLHTPRFILENGYGDCDDKTVLSGALLASLGYKTRCVAVGPLPNVFKHVFLEVKIYTQKGPKWLALDCTENRGLGWAPRFVSRMIRHNK